MPRITVEAGDERKTVDYATGLGPVACYGDSLTAGFGIGATASFPARLSALLPAGAANLGASGQTAAEIAMRQGGQAITLTFPGDTIPASGSTTVTTADAVTWGAAAWTVTGVIGGVAGTLSHPAMTAGTAAVLTFARAAAGTAVTLSGPTSFRSTADATGAQVFLVGRNDIGIGSNAATIQARVLGAYKAMTDYCTGLSLVLSNTTRTDETIGTAGYTKIAGINAALSSTYGNRYLDVRRYLIDSGLRDAGITPTAADTAAIAGDTIPPSLMYDATHWNATATGLVAQQIAARLNALTGTVAPTPGLFFTMPDMTSSPKLVLAHYFGPYPRSINNASTPAGDTYTTSFNNPAYTGAFGGKAANIFGGAFRDRPLFRPPIAGDFKYADARWDIEQAKAAGIDGWFFDLLGLSGSNYDNYETSRRAACDVPFPFYAAPMVDANGRTATNADGTDADPKAAAAYVKRFAIGDGAKGAPPLKSAWFLPDGRFVVGSFKPEGKSLAWWTTMFGYLKSDWGLDAVLVGAYNNFNQSATYTSINYASGPWGYGADPAAINAASNMAATARARGEKYMGPAVVQDQRPQNALYDEARGFGAQNASWSKLIAQDADLVQIVTWSDYSETAIAPSAANGWTVLDLTAWHIARLKTGKYPTILRDAIYLAHRSQTLDATITGGQTSRMKPWPRGTTSPVSNDVEILTFLTAPATVNVTVGTATYTYTAPAGMNSARYPAQPAAAGTVSATAARAGSDVASITSPVAIRTTVPADDRQYFRFSSLRGTTGQFDPLTQYK